MLLGSLFNLDFQFSELNLCDGFLESFDERITGEISKKNVINPYKSLGFATVLGPWEKAKRKEREKKKKTFGCELLKAKEKKTVGKSWSKLKRAEAFGVRTFVKALTSGFIRRRKMFSAFFLIFIFLSNPPRLIFAIIALLLTLIHSFYGFFRTFGSYHNWQTL